LGSNGQMIGLSIGLSAQCSASFIYSINWNWSRSFEHLPTWSKISSV